MNYFSFKSLTMMFVQNFKKSPDGNEKKMKKTLIFFFWLQCYVYYQNARSKTQ